MLPEPYRTLNLLTDARETAITRFAAAGIRWHGDGDGPNPHLLSSQIQCLNTLAPLVDRPEALASWLGRYLPVAEVLPFGATTDSPYDKADYVVFEWQGQVDHLGEWRGRPPTRGALATSVDAAVRYRTPGGDVELALIEWKYTESYPYGGRLSGSAFNQHRRLLRYRHLVEDPNGPVELPDGLDYEDLFAEPTYQLLRQQLLAWRLEEAPELGITRAVVVYAAPAANAALLQESLGSHRFERLAHAHGGLIPAWTSLLRRPDRFVTVDTTAMAEPDSMCSDEYRTRYHHLVSSSEGPVEVGDGHVSSPGTGGAQLDDVLPAKMTGEDLQMLAFDGDIGEIWIGRRGGLTGWRAQEDVTTGGWRSRSYRVTSGSAPPNANWFALGGFLDAVRRQRREARKAAGWEVIGTLIVDSAALAVAVPSRAQRFRTEDHIGELDGIVELVTREDGDFPVETRTEHGQVVEVRIDLVDDVDEVAGEWLDIGGLDVDEAGLIAIDPYRDRGPSDVRLSPGAGHWNAAVFRSAGDDLAVRLLREG